ncbi:Uncharacterised protein [Legionella donaldsonii]|uniref:Uncharacterized protein n=1 Tax=Legionella donaldsonii TaxID=45060 RepID=A0A378J192_9GAMM|nr:Uncharacterised protein [Legionella donaldsonii]
MKLKSLTHQDFKYKRSLFRIPSILVARNQDLPEYCAQTFFPDVKMLIDWLQVPKEEQPHGQLQAR